MYCVKCGVKLQDGVEKCPLCSTKVWNPDGNDPCMSTFSNKMPEIPRTNWRAVIAIILTVTISVAALAVSIVAANIKGSFSTWAGIVLMALALTFILFALPVCLRKPHPMVIIPVDHVALLLFVLYICVYTGGHWFMSFAFPVILINCAMWTTLTALCMYVRGGKFYILGGFIILAGAFTILIEFFLHISFGFGMFRWSLFSACPCFAVGMFLLLVGMIKPLRHYLEKMLFI